MKGFIEEYSYQRSSKTKHDIRGDNKILFSVTLYEVEFRNQLDEQMIFRFSESDVKDFLSTIKED